MFTDTIERNTLRARSVYLDGLINRGECTLQWYLDKYAGLRADALARGYLLESVLRK